MDWGLAHQSMLFFCFFRVVDSHIKNLRHKLGAGYIETVRGAGYRAAKEDL